MTAKYIFLKYFFQHVAHLANTSSSSPIVLRQKPKIFPRGPENSLVIFKLLNRQHRPAGAHSHSIMVKESWAVIFQNKEEILHPHRPPVLPRDKEQDFLHKRPSLVSSG